VKPHSRNRNRRRPLREGRYSMDQAGRWVSVRQVDRLQRFTVDGGISMPGAATAPYIYMAMLG
jgi:hypothetical protein